MASKRLQVIVETHSDHLMNGLRVAVRDELVSPDDTQFIYLRRENGLSLIDAPKIDSDGRLGYWPEGFFDEHEQVLARLVARKQRKQ
jgi:predicted ATPase